MQGTKQATWVPDMQTDSGKASLKGEN